MNQHRDKNKRKLAPIKFCSKKCLIAKIYIKVVLFKAKSSQEYKQPSFKSERDRVK